MIKKIFLTLILFSLIISCGKKGDPKYSTIEKKFEFQNDLTIHS